MFAFTCKPSKLKRDLRPRLFFCFTKKEPCPKFFVVSSSVLTKLWSHRTCKYTKHFIPGFLCIFFVSFMKKSLLHSFKVVLIISHQLIKLQSFEWLNCVLCLWWIIKVFPNKFIKNYEISVISSHTYFHRGNLITTN